MSDLIGEMRQSVKLCINVPTAQGSGAIDNYGILLTTRGRLRRSSGGRSLTFSEIEGNSSYTLITRFQQDIEANISISSKWLIDGVFYTVDSWEKVGEIKFYYKFSLSKKEPPTSPVPSLTDIDPVGLQPAAYFTPAAGGFTIDMGLTPSSIVLLARSGLVYKEVSGAPGDFEFSQSNGIITFSIAFNGSETIYILYKLSS